MQTRNYLHSEVGSDIIKCQAGKVHLENYMKERYTLKKAQRFSGYWKTDFFQMLHLTLLLCTKFSHIFLFHFLFSFNLFMQFYLLPWSDKIKIPLLIVGN